MNQYSLDQMSLPPPLALDLIDGDRPVGWIRAGSIGFRGFGRETEAATAAWLAYGTLVRRLARDTGRPRPMDASEPESLRAGDGCELAAGDGQPFGRLVRPNSGSHIGDSFGFEVDVPGPAGELRMRSMAYLIYRTLRRSGVRWSAPMPAVRTPVAPLLRLAPSPTAFVAGVTLTGIAVVVAIMLIITAPPAVSIPIALALLAGPVWKAAAIVARRRRRWTRRREMRKLAASDATRVAPARSSPGAAPTQRISGPGALAGASIVLLIVALAIPTAVGVAIGAIGLAGLLIVRVFAMNAGWAPRGSAWSRHGRAAPPGSRGLSTTKRPRISDARTHVAEPGAGAGARSRAAVSSG